MVARVLAACVLVVAVLVPSAPAQAHVGRCIGVAPALNECSAGTHVRGGQFIFHGPDLEASSAFIGTIESYLVSPSGNVLRTCHVVMGSLEGCFTDPFSQWPAVGESFTHYCFTYFFNTEIRGGVGPWGCLVDHA